MTIVDDRNISVHEAVFKSGALIRLVCLVRQAEKDHYSLLWKFGPSVLNHDTQRGGVRWASCSLEEACRKAILVFALPIANPVTSNWRRYVAREDNQWTLGTFLASHVFLIAPSFFLSVKTERRGRDAISWLLMARATSRDSGVYTCSVDGYSQATVSVHVIQGNISYQVSSLVQKYLTQ